MKKKPNNRQKHLKNAPPFLAILSLVPSRLATSPSIFGMEYGEERFSRQIARAIVARRDKEPCLDV